MTGSFVLSLALAAACVVTGAQETFGWPAAVFVWVVCVAVAAFVADEAAR